MAAGGAQDRPGSIDGRPVEHPLADHPGKVYAKTADLAYRRDAGIEGGPQVPRAAHGAQRQRLKRHFPQVKDAGAEKVPVTIPHARHDGRGLVHGGARGAGRDRGRARVADPRTVEHDHAVGDRLAAARNQQPRMDPVHDHSSGLPAALGPGAG